MLGLTCLVAVSAQAAFAKATAGQAASANATASKQAAHAIGWSPVARSAAPADSWW